MKTSTILKKIRDLMNELGPHDETIQAIIITSYDQHMNEVTAPRDRILQYVSGFSGSFGYAVITQDEARLWTDGRYYIQAAKQLDNNWHLMKKDDEQLAQWLVKKLNESSNVGFDPKQFQHADWKHFHKIFEISDISLVPILNLTDEIWDNRPKHIGSPIQIHHIEYAGETVASKMDKVWIAMKEKHVDTLILSSLDEIAWLLNLRGQDVEYSPVFFSFLVIRPDEMTLFVDEKKITEPIRMHFKKNNLPININCYESFYGILAKMNESVKKVWLSDPANYNLVHTFPEDKLHQEASPVALMKITKNDAEIKGMIDAHIKDGVAMSRYLSWIEKAINEDIELTEISVAQALEKYRQDEDDYTGPGFQTISGVGPNSALAHYKPNNETNRRLTRNEIYLCDTSSQYLQGTTDVTRTVHFGTPNSLQKECFTRVLLGFISLASAIFPFGTQGYSLDALARRSLWDAGLDYKHATGHGIGSYLNIHESSVAITVKPYPLPSGLNVNMFLSNEPGYYREDDFGIRLENIMQIIPADSTHKLYSNSEQFLTFNQTTLVPFQKKMLNFTLLSKKEINFLNDYHRRVLNTIGPILQKRNFTDAYEWLKRETTAIKI